MTKEKIFDIELNEDEQRSEETMKELSNNKGDDE